VKWPFKSKKDSSSQESKSKKEVKKVDLNNPNVRQDLYKELLGSGRAGHIAHGKK
jgi:hypothetical protein